MRIKKLVYRIFVLGLIFSFVANGHNYAAVYNLPTPGSFTALSVKRSYPVLKGIKVDPAHPLQLQFVVNSPAQKSVSDQEFKKLVNYFLAVLTIPQEDLWVNLSPYEKDQIGRASCRERV